MSYSDLNTQQKALQINVDRRIYGTFAEIGGGQEIARWFFRVGGASGTVAKTMSAYDMTVSDAIYGKSSRYVARDRLGAMLDHEFELLVERLGDTKGKEASLFAFADTVSARNFQGTNECHGWMGLRFQSEPGAAPSDIVMHINMLDKENLQQQEALGVVGVNLIYGAFYDRDSIDSLIENLVDDLGGNRIEIDILEFSGPAFKDVDNRVVGLKLLQLGLANAIIYDPGNRLVQPSEVVRKRPLLIERGAYRALKQLNLDSVEAAKSRFAKSVAGSKEPISLLELSMHEAAQKETVSLESMLERIDQLTAMGHRVIVSRYYEFYQVTSYLRRYTDEPIGFLMGVATLARLFNPEFYGNLEGRLLEGLGRALSHHVKFYVYPMHLIDVHSLLAIDGPTEVCAIRDGSNLVGVDDLFYPDPLSSLYQFLLKSKFIEGIPAGH